MIKKLLLFSFILSLLPALSHAGARRFTYVYEATTAPSGTFELENWVTWKTDRPNDSRFRQFDFRHEVESGLTDRLQMAIYVADWSYRRGNSFTSAGSIYTARWSCSTT